MTKTTKQSDPTEISSDILPYTLWSASPNCQLHINDELKQHSAVSVTDDSMTPFTKTRAHLFVAKRESSFTRSKQSPLVSAESCSLQLVLNTNLKGQNMPIFQTFNAPSSFNLLTVCNK